MGTLRYDRDTPEATSLVGNAPTDRAAVLTFIAAFVLLSLLFLLLVLRARRVAAFRDVVGERDVHLMLGQWASGIVVLVVAAVVTVWLPVAGLSILALTMVLGPVAARRGAATGLRFVDRHLPEG